MKNSINSRNILYTIIGIFIAFSSCKNPIDELKSFKLDLNGNLANTLLKIQFKPNDSSIGTLQNLSVSISGFDAHYVFDENGKTNFTPNSSGVLGIILSPNANPTKEHPIVFNVKAMANGCIPINQDVYVFSKTDKFTVNLNFNSIKNPPAGTTVSQQSLNFLGKKATDTVEFSMTRGDGVSFTVKYPKKGLLFIDKTSIRVQCGVSLHIRTEEIAEYDTTTYQYNDTTELYDIIQEEVGFKNQVVNRKVLKGYTITPAIGTNITRVVTGHKTVGVDTVPQYADKIIFDTIPLSEISATIYSRSDFLAFGYYDENGVFIDKPHYFQGVVGIPYVNFYSTKLNKWVQPYYPLLRSGRVVECYLPNNTYNFYCEGMVQLGNDIIGIKKSATLPNTAYTLENGKYKFAFMDNLLDGQFFLYQSAVTGCGYTDVRVNYPNANFNDGFYSNIFYTSKYWTVSYFTYYTDYSFGNSRYFRVPAFDNDNAKLYVDLNHRENACVSYLPLWQINGVPIQICDYVNSYYSYDVPYDGNAYLQSLPYTPVSLTAHIQCSGGNFVLPPDLTFQYSKLGCAYGSPGSVSLINGQLQSNGFMKNQTYLIEYDHTADDNSTVRIFDTITFNTSKPTQVIEDEITHYYTGTMTYNPSTGFSVDFVFDNRKLKYKINGCGQ